MPRRGWERAVETQDTCKHGVVYRFDTKFRCQHCFKMGPAVKTQVNGVDAPWDEATWSKWHEVSKKWPGVDRMSVTQANYFTPHPYVDEWDRGDTKEGFVYTLHGRDVCMAVISGGVPWIVSPQRP